MSVEKSIMEECDVCHHINPSTYNDTCFGCGHTVCLVCVLKENFECTVCGGYYIAPADF